MKTFRVRLRAVRLEATAIGWEIDRSEAIGWPCPYCWTAMAVPGPLSPTWDHVVPRSAGGTDSRANRLVVCRRCNADKADMPLGQFCGWLKGRGELRRHACVGALIGWVLGADCDPALLAVLEEDQAIGERLGRLAVDRTAWLMADRARSQRDAVSRAAWRTLSAMGVPSTHWTFEAPDSVRLLIGSRFEVIRFVDPVHFIETVRAHPRAKFLKLERANGKAA